MAASAARKRNRIELELRMLVVMLALGSNRLRGAEHLRLIALMVVEGGRDRIA
jgi:hypothetical protein